MSVVILDFGSGETCKNDKAYARRMIDELAAVDNHKHQVFIKWQLFSKVPAPVPPLDHEVYADAMRYAADKYHYLTGASVFDPYQLGFLLAQRESGYELPFVKIACRPQKYRLIEKIPRDIRVYVSVEHPSWGELLTQMYPRLSGAPVFLYCIPQYPANQTEYETLFGGRLHYSISDHSSDLRLFTEYQPLYYERHYKLADSTGLDTGPHASTPEQLKEIL